jgi:transcriptional regulator
MARANPHAKALIEAVREDPSSGESSTNGPLECEVTVLFNGPAHSYVSPQFYTETKPNTGKVVPTWNYSAVQVYGKATIYCDFKSPKTISYLQTQIEDLTKQSEAAQHRQKDADAHVWEVSDAPSPFIDLLKKSIIGIKIGIDRLEGKYKMSQEMGQGDRNGIINGFEGLETDLGSKMARTVEERGLLKDKQAGAR